MLLSTVIAASGRSQADWASTLGITPSYLSMLLSQKKCPSLDLAVRIERLTDGEVPATSWVHPAAPASDPDPREDAA